MINSFIKNLISLKAFVSDNNKYVIKLIKYSQLNYTNDWCKWTDDYGNLLTVTKQSASIKLNEDINPQVIVHKDVYAKAPIKKLLSICKHSVISFNDNVYIWTLDENNILRLSRYANEILISKEPILISGVKNLKIIIENLEVDAWKKVPYITEPFSETVMESYASVWPPQEDLLKLLPKIIKKDI